MIYAELVKLISNILPNATFGEDNDGQLIIYTDKMVDKDNLILDYPGDFTSIPNPEDKDFSEEDCGS